jgi:hypothetical protein
MKCKAIPEGLTGKALFDFVVKNEALIRHAKKSEMKFADSASHSVFFIDDKGQLVSKAATGNTVDMSRLKISVVINTTNFLDSHGDVHIPGLWNKSVADNKATGFYLLKEHSRCFEDVIGDGLKGELKLMSFNELGMKLPGVTEALIFSGDIFQKRNPFMFEQYMNKYVKQHSVGMRYLKMIVCIDDQDYPVQQENWDKYRPMVANGDEADKEGMFWAILEAQAVEGSAVLFASNSVTPTIETAQYENDSTMKEPAQATQQEPEDKSFSTWLHKTKLIN